MRNIILSIVPLFLVVVGFAVPKFLHDRPVNGPELVLVTNAADGNTGIRIAPLDATHWNPDSQLQFSQVKEFTGVARPNTTHATPRPGTRSWAVYSVYPDSGAGDIDLIDLRGLRTRLTHARGDDRPMSFSPDGNKLLFLTTRWNANGWSDVAILDIPSSSVRRVTSNDATYSLPSWSPDGTRIAFTRAPLRRDDSEVCIAASDGASVRCRSVPGSSAFSEAGWVDGQRLLVKMDSAEFRMRWFFYDVEAGRLIRAGYPAGSIVRLDPTGAWAITGPQAGERITLTLSPSQRYDLGLSIGSDSVSESDFFFLMPKLSASFLDSVAIEERSSALGPGIPYQLKAHGWSRDRRTMVPQEARWRSLTPRIARIDSLGVIVAADTGHAIIEFSAGGWRTAIDTLTITHIGSATLLDERWDAHAFERWKSFGEPKPQIVRSEKGNAFFNNGDGAFFSGAYLPQKLNSRRGIAMDFDVTTPLTRTQWQIIEAGVTGYPRNESFRQWDHRTGYISSYMDPHDEGCWYTFPAGEGEQAPTHAPWFESLRAVMGDSAFRLDDGKWYRIRVQIFPNGRCGLAVNGRAVMILPSNQVPPASMMAVLQGNSVGTKVLVGALTIRSGVPTDVDWTKLKFNGFLWVNPLNSSH